MFILLLIKRCRNYRLFLSIYLFSRDVCKKKEVSFTGCT